jgi:hypothetical protein
LETAAIDQIDERSSELEQTERDTRAAIDTSIIASSQREDRQIETSKPPKANDYLTVLKTQDHQMSTMIEKLDEKSQRHIKKILEVPEHGIGYSKYKMEHMKWNSETDITNYQDKPETNNLYNKYKNKAKSSSK